MAEGPSNWLPLALDIAKAHGLPCDDIEVFETGTNLVVGVGPGLILKIYPPFLRRQFTVERITLPLLTGRVDVPTPEIVAVGERDAWPYLVMTRLKGRLGSEVWPRLADDHKAIVLNQIGRTIAQATGSARGAGAGRAAMASLHQRADRAMPRAAYPSRSPAKVLRQSR